VAVSSHGYGHASRTGSILEDLKARIPELAIHVASLAPAAFFPGCRVRPVGLDVGLLQKDFQTIDMAATKSALQSLQASSRLAEEIAFVRKNEVKLVVSDIAPLAFEIAHAAGLPSIAIGNFGWDFIYKSYPELAGFSAAIGASYARATQLLRLPFHEEMIAFNMRRDIEVTGRPSPRDPLELAARYLPATERQKILVTFGGLGLSANVDFKRWPDELFIAFDARLPDAPNLCKILDESLHPRDFLPLCDAVLTKPGYGIFCDILQAGGRPVYCLQRQGFPETPLLEAALKQFFRFRMISLSDLQMANSDLWQQRFSLPANAMQLPGLNGNAKAVAEIIKYIM
jgi:hypothetical protein